MHAVLAYPLIFAQGGLELPAGVLRAPRAPATAVADQLSDWSGGPPAEQKKKKKKKNAQVEGRLRMDLVQKVPLAK